MAQQRVSNFSSQDSEMQDDGSVGNMPPCLLTGNNQADSFNMNKSKFRPEQGFLLKRKESDQVEDRKDKIPGLGMFGFALNDKQVAPSEMESGEVIQQFSSRSKTFNGKSNIVTQQDMGCERKEEISMGELIDALDQDHMTARMAQAPRGPRAFARPSGRWSRGRGTGRRFVHPDDLLENNNYNTNTTSRHCHSPRRLVDSYRPGQEHDQDKDQNQNQDQDINMADSYDRGGREDRGGYERGGDRGDRGGRGGFNRKKRFREDDDFERRDNRPQRRRYEEPPPGTRLRKQLNAVAESPMRNPEDEVHEIAKLAYENWEDNYVKEVYCDVTLALLIEQPFKIPFVAAVVMHANTHKPDVAAEIIKRAAEFCQQHFESGDWRTVKLILRFLACLSALYNDDGVFPILDELFNRAVDLQTASAEDTLGLEFVKIILFTIPYALASSATDLEQKAAELLEKTDIVASAPHTLEALVDPYPADGDDEKKPVTCTSLLRVLQAQLQAEAANGWKLSCIPRLFKPADLAMDGADQDGDADKTLSKHSFPALTVPSTVNPGPKPLFPELYFSLFADQEIESVPPTADIASSLIRDAITDTINILDFNRNACAKFLIDIDCYWAEGTFVKRATAFDKLRDVPDGRSTWKPEDVVIDAVFSQIFTLPTPEHKLVYFHSVITESCKIAPAAIAPSLGRAIRFLFRNIDVMDLELAYRYMDWFAHHLSNFEFRWKWTEWIDDLDSSDLTPKKAFIIGALDKEIRLSFAKRIRETLPTQYAPLITEGKVKDAPDLKFLNEATPYAAQGSQVYQLLRKKAPEEEIQKQLDEIEALAREQGVTDTLIQSTDTYVTCILHIGSKSLSHVLSCIERCKERLLAIGPQSEAARRQIISSVISYWEYHPGTAVNIIDKLLNYTIITPSSVVEWALKDHLDSGRALSDTKVYEMVTCTMNKVSNRMRQIVKARNDVAGSAGEQKALLDETLVRERQSMRDLFATIIDAVEGVRNASADEMIERFEGGEVEQKLIQDWGKRWVSVFSRRAAVEEAVCGEAAIETADRLAAEALDKKGENGEAVMEGVDEGADV